MASSLRELNLDPFGQQPQRIPIYRDEPEFVDRVRNNQNYPVINNPDGSVSTHRMAAESDANGNWYVFPTIQMQDGELVEYYDSRDAMDAAFKTGNILRAPNKQSALNYAEGAYKRDTGLGDRPVSTLRGLQELSPSDPLYIHQDPMPAGADIMTQQEAISELGNREMAARAAGTVSPFESSFNPTNPNFRATAQNAISNMLGGSNISSNPNYLQGRIANTLSGVVDFIPAVGDAVGVGDTITSYRQGDMLGTGINAAAAALGIVPVLGDAAGKGIKNLSSLRDIGGPMPVVTRDTEFLKRVGDVDSVNNLSVKMSDPELSSVPIVRAEDLEDRAYMTGITDTSRSTLERVGSVNGVEMDVPMRGGSYFGFQPNNIERKHGFASAKNAVVGQLNRAKLAQKASPREGVIFAGHGMMGASPDFATMTAEIAIPYAREVLSKSSKEAVDKAIRLQIPSWVGIDGASNEYLASIGGKRKIVTNALDSFRDEGALNLSQLRSIITDPNQVDKPWGEVNAFYKLDPRAYNDDIQIIEDSTHPSYKAALLMEADGALGAPREGFSILRMNPLMGTGSKASPEISFLDEMSRRRDVAQRAYDHALQYGNQQQIGAASAALKGYNIEGGAGSSIQSTLKAGGHGVFSRNLLDGLIKEGKILP